MRTLRFLLVKEFKQIFRNRTLLPMIFLMPLIQLLILPLAADYEIKNINVYVVDHDKSTFSRDLISMIISSGYFKLVDYDSSYKRALSEVERNKADLILEIPNDFERNLNRDRVQKVFIAINAINGTKAGLGGSYLSTILKEFNKNIVMELDHSFDGKKALKRIDVVNSNWFNPYLDYKTFMVPAILVILVTMIGAYMCSLNIVKEKEIGTIEQINVTPIKKHVYVLGKLIPFWIIGMGVFSIGFFVISWGVYGIVPIGNILLLYGYLALYLVALLGFGLLVSTYAENQQQAMSVAFFFVMIFILMSGLFTPIESMPEWAKWIAKGNPVTYFIEVMRMVVLKGSGYRHIQNHFLIMMGFAVVLNFWAIANYRKTS
ncbi:ABC transporter permease [Muricauda sp. 334s03]|uniref:ABC transporter permease n=2 Tax=Flagellimonas TaxID=444459 RepID=A0ABT5XNR7_9FLAO|nr:MULTISPECIES: ABC transporter permease [Allomuricauda]MDF0707442.1 ABC transporter permease [[Muricauda] okinawensis]MDF0715342.1 ABC transporter permease [[Muricauda] yonaguniensis]